jgi:outer membrane lipoprotein-sorting protein
MISAVVCILALAAVSDIASQEILTAEKYLARIGEKYAGIKDYEAKIGIQTASIAMNGTLAQRSPNLLRIDFVKPEEQVILFDGGTLTVYLPEYRAVLSQSVSSSGKLSGAALASPQGLTLLRRNYTVAYTVGPDPLPLEENSSEQVIKLSLTRRNASEGFSTLQLAIGAQSELIRRIEGRTIADETVIFDFTDMKVNQGIPEARFLYDSPASANMYNNFLFKNTD